MFEAAISLFCKRPTGLLLVADMQKNLNLVLYLFTLILHLRLPKTAAAHGDLFTGLE